MWPEFSGPAELNDAAWPGEDDWPGDEEADAPDPDWPDDWPGDERADAPDPDWPDDWPEDDARDGDGGAGLPWPAAPAPPPGWDGRPGGRGPRPLVLVVVAVVALLAGGVALAITRELDRSAAPAAAPSSQPSGAVPGGGTGGGAPPGSAGAGTAGEIFIMGRLAAVSSTSVTIGGPGGSETAAVTSATKVTGTVTSVGGLRVGDQVSAQIVVNDGRATATAIQDPAQAPSSGGGLP
jgi:hypothetical protein